MQSIIIQPVSPCSVPVGVAADGSEGARPVLQAAARPSVRAAAGATARAAAGAVAAEGGGAGDAAAGGEELLEAPRIGDLEPLQILVTCQPTLFAAQSTAIYCEQRTATKVSRSAV